MPTDALITAGGSLLGQGINAAVQGGMNRKTRKWNEKMYALQRQHALEDWARINEYNKPLSQMQRFKEAGLNPHLIYGQSNTADPVRSTDVKQWSPQAPRFDFGQIVDQYLGTRQAGVAFDIGKEQSEKLRLENDAQRIKNLMLGIDLEVHPEKRKAQIDAILADIVYKGARTQFTISENARQALRNEQDLEIGAVKLIGMEIDNANKLKDGFIKDQTLSNLQATNDILIHQGSLKKLEVVWKQFGLTDNSSRLEWIMAQFLMDPLNAEAKLKQYTEDMSEAYRIGLSQIPKAVFKGWKGLFGDAYELASGIWEKVWGTPEPGKKNQFYNRSSKLDNR